MLGKITRLEAALGARLREVRSVLLNTVREQMNDFELHAGRKLSLWLPLCYVPTRSVALNTCLLTNE